MDNTFGAGVGSDLTQRPWFHIFEDSLGRLQSLGGLTYNFVTHDDGVAMRFNNIGILDQRADIRIMGKNIDGNVSQNTLAYNSYPNDGDMTIDTSNGDYFDNLARGSFKTPSGIASCKPDVGILRRGGRAFHVGRGVVFDIEAS
jgi:hypothetical protein